MAVIERLGPEDIEILRLESRTVAGHALKVAMLRPSRGAGRLDVEAFRERVADRLWRAPRLRCKLRPGDGRCAAAWVEDPAFDVRRHVRRLPVSEAVSADELGGVVARIMEARLDRSRPLWTLDVLDRIVGGEVCMIWKIHHALADGPTALRFADAVLWDTAPNAEHVAPAACAGRLGALAAALEARRPARLPPTLRRELRRTRDPSPFDGAIGSARTVALSSVPLAALKRGAKALVPSATVNDLVLALVAGALGRSPAIRGRRFVRARVPVSLHQPGEGAAVANRGSFFVVSLPVDEPDPVERLRRISARTGVCKAAGDPRVLDTMLGDLRRIAPPLRRAVERLESHPCAVALDVSNVSGPAERPSVLDAPVRALYSIAEVAQRHGLRVAIVSMADELHFGLCADTGIVPDLDPLVRGIQAEARAFLERSAG